MTTKLKPDAPGLLKRLLIVVYDGLLLFGVLFLATACLLLFRQGAALPAGQPWYFLYLLTVSFAFYGWFWTHGGQTLGMKAWKVKMCRLDGSSISWRAALIRFGVAMLSWGCLGLGFVWILLRSDSRAWHDLASESRMVKLL